MKPISALFFGVVLGGIIALVGGYFWHQSRTAALHDMAERHKKDFERSDWHHAENTGRIFLRSLVDDNYPSLRFLLWTGQRSLLHQEPDEPTHVQLKNRINDIFKLHLPESNRFTKYRIEQVKLQEEGAAFKDRVYLLSGGLRTDGDSWLAFSFQVVNSGVLVGEEMGVSGQSPAGGTGYYVRFLVLRTVGGKELMTYE
jgi:hypothetical protein